MGVDVSRACSVSYSSCYTDSIQKIWVCPFFGVQLLIFRRVDDVFLGIGAATLLETFVIGTVVATWADQLETAYEDGNYVYVLANATRLIQYWYSTSATYNISIVLPCPVGN